MINEEWKEIPNYPGYLVSNLGRYLILLLISCAHMNNYLIESKPECEAQCASYGYGMQSYSDNRCVCDGRCIRPRNHGGCEKLPETVSDIVRM